MGLLSAFLKFHQTVYEKTGGRLGHRMIGVPSLLLRTTGRKSGEPRTSALVYATSGDELVVVASNGGDDRAPGWLYNVEAKPDVEIQVARKATPATARIVRRGDADYDELWKLVNDNNGNRYDGYQHKTVRPIPLVAITPAPDR